MLIGAHAIIYSKRPGADRAFLKRILKLPSVDVGGGWLIFGLPPSEVAVHPAGRARHELYLMVDDIQRFMSSMKRHKVRCDPVRGLAWGSLCYVKLPGGGKLGVYQPKHARPPRAVGRRKEGLL